MIVIPLLFQLATVGDTIWVRRTVPVQPGREVRAAAWQPGGDVEVLGRPRVVRRGDVVEVAYPVAVWAPGEHRILVPGPLLVGRDGRTDSLPAAATTLVIGSVLPRTIPDTGVRPQPPTPTLAMRETSLAPLALLWGAALLLLAPLHIWWRRRGRRARPAAPVPAAAALPIERWIAAGEARTVAAVAVERLRAALAHRPDASSDELRELLRALDTARFGRAHPADAAALYHRAEALERRLAAEAT